MKVKIAKHAGICMGVDLALKKLDSALSDKSKKIVTLGPIIHNPQVLKEYEEQGVEILNSVYEIESDMRVLIRAHGISKEDEAFARENAFEVIDATCPKVKTAQLAVEKATRETKEINPENSVLLFYGEKEHPEVRGILSYSSIPYYVFSKSEEVYSQVSTAPQNFVLASQTTQDSKLFNEYAKTIKFFIGNRICVLDTICEATRERQAAVRRLVKSVDAFIVIGGRTSGNTRRLAEIASSYGVLTYHIESVSELKIEENQKNFTFALTAGASTPKRYIEEVKKFLESFG